MIVLSSELGAQAAELIKRAEGVVRSGGGTIDGNHRWGLRRLAYPIKKQGQGDYYLLEYTAGPEVVKELERTLRITDGVLRFLSVQQEHTGLPEPRRREPYAREHVPMSELRSVDRPERAEPQGQDSPGADQDEAGSPDDVSGEAETGAKGEE